MLVGLGLQFAVMCTGLFLKSDLNSAGNKSMLLLARRRDCMPFWPFCSELYSCEFNFEYPLVCSFSHLFLPFELFQFELSDLTYSLQPEIKLNVHLKITLQRE